MVLCFCLIVFSLFRTELKLSGKCLAMSHSTVYDNLIVRGNHSLWSKDEREEII